MSYIIDRLKENSTWRGIIMIVAALGVKLEPSQAEAIISAGLALVGLLNVFRKEAK